MASLGRPAQAAQRPVRAYLTAAARRFVRNSGVPVLLIFVLTVIGCVVAGLLFPDSFRFLSEENLTVMLRAIPLLGIIGLGVGLLMISGEFDLSVGVTYILGPLLMAMAYDDGAGWPLWLAAILGLLSAVAVGLVNGFVTIRFAIPSFITTLGTMFILRGVVRLISAGQPHSFYPGETVEEVMTGTVGGFEAQFLWLIGFAVAAYLLLNRHRLGNQMFATGGNREAAIGAGIDVNRVKVFAFVLCAVMATVSGMFSTVRLNSVTPLRGFSLELQAITVCVVGGLFLFGGRGSILGIVVAAAFVYTVLDVMLLLRAPGNYFEVFIGAIAIVAVALNTRLTGRR